MVPWGTRRYLCEAHRIKSYSKARPSGVARWIEVLLGYQNACQTPGGGEAKNEMRARIFVVDQGSHPGTH